MKIKVSEIKDAAIILCNNILKTTAIILKLSKIIFGLLIWNRQLILQKSRVPGAWVHSKMIICT